MDLEDLVSGYTGAGRIHRLLFIAEHSTELRPAAVRQVVDLLRTSNNTALYCEVFDRRFPNVCGEMGLVKDAAWVDATDRKAGQQLDRLEQELNAHKSNLNKDAIRASHNEIGDFFASRGDYGGALKSYVRTRDYCTTPKHTVDMCLSVVRVSVLMNNYTHVVNYIAKADQAQGLGEDSEAAAKFHACAGLAKMDSGAFEPAARAFLEVRGDADLGDVVCARDVGLYGGLCALASFSRRELRTQVVENHAFRCLLELTPDLQRAVEAFHASRYAECFASLERLRPRLALDLRAWSHAGALLAKVRSRALVNYFSPYRAVDMGRMAQAFGCDVPALEKELEGLINAGTIAARIDSHRKVLYGKDEDPRQNTYSKTVALGDEFLVECRALLLRVNLLKSDFVVKRATEDANA